MRNSKAKLAFMTTQETKDIYQSHAGGIGSPLGKQMDLNIGGQDLSTVQPFPNTKYLLMDAQKLDEIIDKYYSNDDVKALKEVIRQEFNY